MRRCQLAKQQTLPSDSRGTRGCSFEEILMKQLARSVGALLICCSVTFSIEQEAHHRIPLALSISGGTSLGAYEAGYCYYFTEWVKKNEALFDLRVVTGTSAGSINALITFLSMADTAPVSAPQSSAFFQTWSDIDFSRIRGPDTRLGIFGRTGIKHVADMFIPKIRKRANHKTDRYLGITATHLNSYNQEVVSGLTIPTIKQQFVVHGTTDSAGAWTFLNHIDSSSKLPTAVLPLKAGDSTGNDTVLRELILASTGIPGLFQPYKIRHLQVIPWKLHESGIRLADLTNDLYDSLLALKCRPRINERLLTKWIDPQMNWPYTKGIDPDTVWPYVDGGILNNSPIRLARQIIDSVFPEKSTRSDLGGIETRPQADSFRYVYLSAENTLYPAMKQSKSRDSLCVFKTLGNGLLDWVDAARQNELFTLKEENPDIEKWLLLSRNYYPVYSRFMRNLFGFLEKDLRIFDFYLGMYDAQKFFSGDALGSMGETVRNRIRRPDIRDTSYDKICTVLDGKASGTYSNNLDRLTGLSRELYFWYWKNARCGIDQQRMCAREFAAEISGLFYDSIGRNRFNRILDTLKNFYSINPDDLKHLVRLVSSVTGIPVEMPFRGSKVRTGKRRTPALPVSLTDAKLDSVFAAMQELSAALLSKQKSDTPTLLCKMFGYESPLCEHFLEERYRRSILPQTKLPDSGSFSKHLADTSVKNEFETVLNLMNDVGFQYSDLVDLDRERHLDTMNGRWMTDAAKVPMKPMSSAEVNQKIKLALSKLLRDYSNEPGGPEPERNVVNMLGNPILGFVSNTPPIWIMYGAVTMNGGEAGIGAMKQWTLPKLPHCLQQWLPQLLSPRYIVAFAADSVVLADAQPSAQGLTMPYRGPIYMLGGLEWELYRKPWIQLRIGARFGRKLPEGGENRIQFYPTLVVLERLRIGLCVEGRHFDNENLGSLKSRGLLPSVNIGCELFSW
jgi:predicted acylesterase/phospholipase RssA